MLPCPEDMAREQIDRMLVSAGRAGIVLLESGQELEMPLSRNLAVKRPGLHELRIRDKAGQVRVIYYLKKGDAVYLVHAFRKKTQAALAKKLGISQARVAQIESGVSTAKVTFDVLFNMLAALGLDHKVVTRKAA